MIRTLKNISSVLLLSLSLETSAATNQVYMTTGVGAVLTAPWICDQTALTNFTVSAWIAVDGTTSPADRVIIERAVMVPSGNPISFPSGSRINFRLGIDQQGHPFASFHGNSHDPIEYKAIAESETLVDGQWTHLAAEYDFPYLKLFMNGHLVRTNEIGELACNGWFGSALSRLCFPGTITIGAGNADPTGVTTNLNSFFSGRIDEVVVWNGALKDSDISTWMNRKPTGIEPNLVAYWSFDDGSASDTSTNGVKGVFFQATSAVERIISPVTVGISVSTNIVIEFQTVQDSLYAVEVCTDLMATNWLSVGTSISGTGANCVVDDTNSYSAGFYRVRSW